MNKNKIKRLRFAHLKGDTSLGRMIKWLRRRYVRSFIWFTLFAAIFCSGAVVVILETDFTSSNDVSGDFTILVMFILTMIAVLMLWVRLFYLTLRPSRTAGLRRLGKLGDMEKFASDLEADLTPPDGVLFKRGGVYVTRRFIIDMSWGMFRIYPLDGLLRYDEMSAPVFYYENGTSCKAKITEPFVKLKPYIKTADQPEMLTQTELSTEKKKLGIKNVIIYLIILGCMIVAYFAGGNVDGFYVWIPRVVGCIIGAAVIYVFYMMIFTGIRNSRRMVMLSQIKDLDERICKIEEFYTKDKQINTPSYYNDLSTIYYEKGDCEKALELNRKAIAAQPRGQVNISIGVGWSMPDVVRMNEITYLNALARYDEAERLLNQLGTKRYKGAIAISNLSLIWAQIYVGKGHTKKAREYMCRASSVFDKLPPKQKENTACYFLLLQGECDFLEQDTVSALTKLDQVISRCTWPPTVNRAKELRDSILSQGLSI